MASVLDSCVDDGVCSMVNRMTTYISDDADGNRDNESAQLDATGSLTISSKIQQNVSRR